MKDPQNNDPKQFNASAVESEHVDHQTNGEVALDNQQYNRIAHSGHHETIGDVSVINQHRAGCQITDEIMLDP